MNTKTITKFWKSIENLFFVGFFFSILYITILSFMDGTLKSFVGMGFLQDISDPVHKKMYYKSILAILSILTTFFLLLEMIRLFFKFNPLLDIAKKLELLNKPISKVSFFIKTKIYFSAFLNTTFITEFLRRYKTNFLAKVFNDYISKLFIIFVYIEMMPYFHKFALFSIPNNALGWLYAYLMWELTYWIWHFLGHRVRLFWCLHSPHHAPVEMNLTVAWVHFFAEGYYTAAVQVPLLMLFGVSPEMVAIILIIDGTWGTFIHCGEDAFKNGRMGILEKVFITPSHHRVHHAKNPLYIDTNFCVLLPFWDWLFGTLQTEKREVKIEYGITRETDATSFIDMYFGEFICLFNDIRTTKGFRNKVKMIIMPPGWYPDSTEQLATVVRGNFLKQNPVLGKTSRDYLFEKLNIRK
jgi:sterol desaturase/sphingolipid hydroxylase (fatty acid hydroxylase superfamily)